MSKRNASPSSLRKSDQPTHLYGSHVYRAGLDSSLESPNAPPPAKRSLPAQGLAAPLPPKNGQNRFSNVPVGNAFPHAPSSQRPSGSATADAHVVPVNIEQLFKLLEQTENPKPLQDVAENDRKRSSICRQLFIAVTTRDNEIKRLREENASLKAGMGQKDALIRKQMSEHLAEKAAQAKQVADLKATVETGNKAIADLHAELKTSSANLEQAATALQNERNEKEVLKKKHDEIVDATSRMLATEHANNKEMGESRKKVDAALAVYEAERKNHEEAKRRQSQNQRPLRMNVLSLLRQQVEVAEEAQTVPTHPTKEEVKNEPQ